MLNFKILPIACLPLLLCVASCGGDDKPNTPACTTFDYSKYTPASTTLTLTADVMPIFATSCAVATCHAKGSVNPPILGDLPPGMTVTAADVRAAIVDVTSKEVTSMKYVVANQPENSYLMRKVENTNPGCGLACTSTPPAGCSTQMPSGLDALSAAQQGTIRDWIKAGAPN